MKKNRLRKRTLRFERLEAKASPAALLVALAPLPEAIQERLEPVLQMEHGSSACHQASEKWQFSHSVIALLKFVDQNTLPSENESTVCSPPTWDQCRIADEMMQLKDHALQTVVMAQQLQLSPSDWNS